MAQKMIEIKNLEISNRIKNEKFKDFIIDLSENKTATLRYSKSYKDLILDFNINRAKKLILTKAMWLNLIKNLEFINENFK